MVTKRQAAAGLCLLAGMVLAGYAGLARIRSLSFNRGSYARIGSELPSLEVVDEGGRRVDLARAVLGGKSVIVFYSPSCGVCRRVLPELQPFPTGLRLFMVNEGAARSLKSRDDLGPDPSQVYRDPDRVFSRAFPLTMLPAILFVDERGVLQDALVGGHARGLVRKKLKEAQVR